MIERNPILPIPPETDDQKMRKWMKDLTEVLNNYFSRSYDEIKSGDGFTFPAGLVVEGNGNVKGDGNVDGSLNVKGNLDVDGNLNVDGNAVVDGNLDVGVSIGSEGDLLIGGDAEITGDLQVNGGADYAKHIKAGLGRIPAGYYVGDYTYYGTLYTTLAPFVLSGYLLIWGVLGVSDGDEFVIINRAYRVNTTSIRLYGVQVNWYTLSFEPETIDIVSGDSVNEFSCVSISW